MRKKIYFTHAKCVSKVLLGFVLQMVLHVVRFGICITKILIDVVSSLNYNVWNFIASVKDTISEHLQMAMEKTGIWLDELKAELEKYQSED